MEQYAEREDLNALVEWAKARGCYLSPKVFLVGSENGSTAVAVNDLEPGEEIISCSNDAVLGPVHARKLFGDELADSNPELIRPLTKLALVHELLLGKDSYWSDYIRTLPREDELSVPMYFSDNDLQWLRGTNMENEVDVKKEHYKDEYEKLIEVVGSRVDTTKYTLDLYIWSSAIFKSRCFPGRLMYPNEPEDAPMLLPLIDALNHRPLNATEWNVSARESFKIALSNATAVGEEIFNNYGAKGNEELLFGYGFCIPNNPFDTLRLKLPPTIPQQAYDEAGPEATKEPTLTLEQPLPAWLVKLFESFITQAAGLTPHSIVAVAQSADVLLQALRVKLHNLIAQAPASEPANSRQKNAQTYREGQIAICRAAVDACMQARDDAVRSRGASLVTLETITRDDPKGLIEAVGQCFLENPSDNIVDDLVEVDLEEPVLLLALAMHSASSSDGSAATEVDDYYNQLYEQVYLPVHQTNPNLPSIQPQDLQRAGTLMANGYASRDLQGRDRYTVVAAV